ncbi:MAG: aminotransferase class I/II-fold pyridoxal phosphate-dependent enzyme, partial [Acidaminococcaceae bacterium]
MAIKYAQRMQRMQASEIRELLKLTQRPEIISFAGGLPAPELFPVEEIAQVSSELLLKEGRQLLQYATTEGRPSFRQKIAARMLAKYQTKVDADEILITTGSQQCLDFAGKLFLDPGDIVLCESPSYLGALNAF